MSERFTQIMNDFLRAQNLSPAAKLVGAVIASYANSDAVAWPGTATLKRETGLGRHVIERARSELVRGGWLQKLYPRRNDGQFSGVRYRVSGRILHRPYPPNRGKRADDRIDSPFPRKTGKP